MTDLRKRLSVTTLAFLALAFCSLLIGQAVANSERVRDVNADNSIETGVPLPTVKAPGGSALSNEIGAPGLVAGEEILGEGSLIAKLKSVTPHVADGIAKGTGDYVTDPFIIGTIAYNHVGDNTGGIDAFSSNACGYDPCVDYGACVADQWFAYTPTANVRVVITTGNGPAGGDQMLIVFDGLDAVDPTLPGPAIACGDDISGTDFRSRLTDVHFDVGHTYYILIDGWAEGPYRLDVTIFVPPPAFNEVIWASKTQTEVEACGTRVNGGSYGNPPAGSPPPWTAASLVPSYLSGQVIPGTDITPNVLGGILDCNPAFASPAGYVSGTSRDADSWRWRQVNWQRVRVTYQGENSSGIFLNDLGTGAAAGGTAAQPIVQSPATPLVTYVWTILLRPNAWYTINIRAASQTFICGTNPIPASGGNPRYFFKLENVPLTPIDDCPLALEYSGDTPVGTPIIVDMRTTTTDGTYTYPGYGTQNFTGSAWIKFTPDESGYYTISACTTPQVGASPSDYDLFLAAFYWPCMPNPAAQLAFSDDSPDCGGVEPQIGEGTRGAIVPGTGMICGENIDYLIGIGDWNYGTPNRGDAWIEIWHEPLPLLNNNCAVYKTPITEDKFGEFYHNLGATLDGPAVTACTNNDFGGDVWYQVTAWKTGHMYGLFCNVNFDANIEVYAGTACPTANPPQAVPIRCNDDGCPDLFTYGNGSYVDWPVVSGEQYLIRAGGWYQLPTYPLTAYGMGFGWFDLFITDQPDTLKGPTVFGTTTVPETVGPPVNDFCVDVTPVALVNDVVQHRTGNQNWMTRDVCTTLPPNDIYSAADVWEAFTVPAGGCMRVSVDYFGFVDLCDNTHRSASGGTRFAVAWVGCPCEGDFFAITADRSCLNNASATPCVPTIPGGDFNNYHEFSMLPSGDYWFMHNHWTIGGICGWGDYVINIKGTTVPCVYCAASSNPAQCTNLGNWINRVILATYVPGEVDTAINNSVAGTGCHNYENFTGLMSRVYRGFSYRMQIRYAKVNPGNLQYDTAGYWVDWNQNAVFFDPGERYVANHANPPDYVFFDTVLIPMTALAPGTGGSGQTLLRVRLASTGDVGQPASCGTPMFGEVEDYVLTVKNLECGDFDTDGDLDQDDIAFLRAWYFGTGPAAKIWKRGNVDGVTGITIADIIALADAAYRGGTLNCL